MHEMGKKLASECSLNHSFMELVWTLTFSFAAYNFNMRIVLCSEVHFIRPEQVLAKQQVNE